MEYSWSTSGSTQLSIQFFCSTPNATIHWTVKGGTGTPPFGFTYSGEVSNGGFTQTFDTSKATVTAYATASGYKQSDTLSKTISA